MRLIVLGNSGSGKSTLAKQVSTRLDLAHLDLDTVAWKQEMPGEREDFETAAAAVVRFCLDHKRWVIEGCYSTLLTVASRHASHMVFLNPGIETCQANCRHRPWESHKYSSKAAQDQNLAMLLDWVAEYDVRTDEYSLSAHQAVFQSFQGLKYEWKSNQEADEGGMSLIALNS